MGKKSSNAYLFLLRHGRSQGNEDPANYLTKANWEIDLTQLGQQQARDAGKFLDAYLAKPEFDGKRTYLWRSPYNRAAQTAKLVDDSIKHRITKYRTSRHLREQDFGLFDGLSDEQREEQYPEEWSYYKRQCGADGRGEIFAPIPLGESKAQVGDRLNFVEDSIFRDVKKGTPIHIMVCHNVVMRMFAMDFLNKDFSWYKQEPSPGNCNVRLIERSEEGAIDHGYIYTGKKAEIDAAMKAAPRQL